MTERPDVTTTPQYVSDMLVELNPDAPEKLFYFSFADGSLPAGAQFLGALFIRAKSLSGAITASHVCGLNPGGEIQTVDLPPEADARVDAKWIGRLLSREELGEMDREMLGPPQKPECPACNDYPSQGPRLEHDPSCEFYDSSEDAPQKPDGG